MAVREPIRHTGDCHEQTLFCAGWIDLFALPVIYGVPDFISRISRRSYVAMGRGRADLLLAQQRDDVLKHHSSVRWRPT